MLLAPVCVFVHTPTHTRHNSIILYYIILCIGTIECKRIFHKLMSICGAADDDTKPKSQRGGFFRPGKPRTDQYPQCFLDQDLANLQTASRWPGVQKQVACGLDVAAV